MDMFDFEELAAEMLDVTDDQREDDDYLPQRFYDKYGIEFDAGYKLTKDLLLHTLQVEAGLSGKKYHAFVSRKGPVMLMRREVNDA